MDNPAFQAYIEDRYKHQMEYYKTTAARNQKRYKQFQWILIILSALTPVFAALKAIKFGIAGNSYAIDLSVVVLVMSSLVAILTTGLKTFNYQELWVNARNTYEKLKPEIHYFNFGVGPYAAQDTDRESTFITRIETILGTEHDQWPLNKKPEQKEPKEEPNN